MLILLISIGLVYVGQYFTSSVVSGMAKWLRHSLAKWKVPGSNLTMEKVSEKSFGKKKASQLSSACMMEVWMTGVLPNS